MERASALLFAMGLLASPLVVIVALGADARLRRAERRRDEPSLAVLATRLPTGDLALSGGARWLRSPSIEEPNAAFADGPALPDPDPAGGMMAPPVAVWRDIAK